MNIGTPSVMVLIFTTVCFGSTREVSCFGTISVWATITAFFFVLLGNGSVCSSSLSLDFDISRTLPMVRFRISFWVKWRSNDLSKVPFISVSIRESRPKFSSVDDRLGNFWLSIPVIEQWRRMKIILSLVANSQTFDSDNPQNNTIKFSYKSQYSLMEVYMKCSTVEIIKCRQLDEQVYRVSHAR